MLIYFEWRDTENQQLWWIETFYNNFKIEATLQSSVFPSYFSPRIQSVYMRYDEI